VSKTRGALALMEQAANDPNLELSGAAIALCRGVLHGAIHGSHTLTAAGVGEMLRGLAALQETGGSGGDLRSALADFAQRGEVIP